MLFNANFVVLATLLAAGVHAQTPTTTGSASAPTSTSQVPPCVLDCAEAALKATNGACTSLTDPCTCTNQVFLTSAEDCLQKKCSAADQAAALQINQELCGSSSSGSSSATSGSASSGSSGAASSTGSASAGSAPSGSSGKSSSSSGTASSTSATASTKSAGHKISLGQAGLFALGISVVGAVVGGLIV